MSKQTKDQVQDSPEMVELKQDLRCHIGTSAYHRVNFFIKKFIATDGIVDYLEKAQCFYLADKLALEAYPKIIQRPHDTYYMKIVVGPKGSMAITIKDWQDELVYLGSYRRSTHPEGEFSSVIGWDGEYVVWCLHSEN